MTRLLILAVLLALPSICGADEIENWIEESPDPEELSQWLDELREHPLDVNEASRHDLLTIPFVDERAARIVLSARRERGNFRDLEEVLGLRGLTEAQRLSFSRFTTVVTREFAPRRAEF
ncbi:helix-hairpin-helix domain-containing protein, partial [bacterium]|nr:helix-hairpin-helix domain-containing protein [bacterium]